MDKERTVRGSGVVSINCLATLNTHTYSTRRRNPDLRIESGYTTYETHTYFNTLTQFWFFPPPSRRLDFKCVSFKDFCLESLKETQCNYSKNNGNLPY